MYLKPKPEPKKMRKRKLKIKGLLQNVRSQKELVILSEIFKRPVK